MLKLNKAPDGALRQQIVVNGHTLFSDAGAAFGGNDSAADPHDLYDAALASCKAITLMIYARRKQIPLQNVILTLYRDSSQQNAGLYQLKVQLELQGDLTQVHQQQLLEIAEKCPVHKLMTELETRIITELVQPER